MTQPTDKPHEAAMQEYRCPCCNSPIDKETLLKTIQAKANSFITIINPVVEYNYEGEIIMDTRANTGDGNE